MNDQNKELVLSNGIKVTVGAINSSAYLEISSQLDAGAPKPPQTYVKSIKAWQPNYDHPDYQHDVSRYQLVTTQRIMQFFLADGVKSVVCPPTIPDHNSPEFKKRVELIGINYPEDEDERRLLWLKLVAMENPADLNRVSQEIARLSGVSESDVQTAEAAFPSNDK